MNENFSNFYNNKYKMFQSFLLYSCFLICYPKKFDQISHESCYHFIEIICEQNCAITTDKQT